MGKSVRQVDGDGLPIPVSHQDTTALDGDGLPIPVKKKDGAGAASPSGSSPKLEKTGPQDDTSGSGSSQHQLTNNYQNNSLTPADVHSITKGPTDIKDWGGLDPEKISHGINNKGKNLSKWADGPTDSYVTSLLNHKKEVEENIQHITTQNSMDGFVPDYESRLSNYKQHDEYLRTQIQKAYDTRKEKIIPELLDDLKKKVDVNSWVDAYGKPDKEILGMKIKSPLEWNAQTHKLTPKSVEWVAKNVDDVLNKRRDPTINAQVSGDLDQKDRTYQDMTRSVVDYLNTIPVRKAQDDFTREYTAKNPKIKDAFDATQKVNEYFSKDNVDAIKARVNVDRDKEFMKTGQKYYGPGGIFYQNKDFEGIQHKYAQLVADGKMTEGVAKVQIQAEIKENPALKKINENMEAEIRKINEKTQTQFQDYMIAGLKKDRPNLAIYKDGTVGVAGLSKDQYANMMEGYYEGINEVGKKLGLESEAATIKQANDKAKNVGAFWGSVGSSVNDLTGAFSKFIFNKTQWGAKNVNYYEGQEIASPQISQSQVAASWNWKGIESLKDPNFWLSKTGSMVPVIAGAGAIGLATEGAGMPEYVGWLANAGLFTAQSGLSTYNQLLNTRDAQGNMLTEADAAHSMASQMQKDFLPNLLMMAATSGTLLKAKNIPKPSLLGTAARGLAGAAIAQPFFTWQGYNDYATMQEAEGKKADFWDYMQSKDFKDNLINGMVVGGGLSLLHAPGTYMKSVDNWTKMIHTSEGEFKNLIPQNYALGQEMNGNGNYLRDALKLHLFNVDPEGLNPEGKRQLADLKNQLLYSVNLDRNIRNGNLDPTNIKDLYQAHNLSLADQHDHLAEQATKEGNKSLSDIYSDKAKDYREQAKAASNGEAKYHYLVNDEGHPIFMSDKSFKVLEAEGTIAKWMKDGTIENVHNSDDPDFAQRYKDFVQTKDEASVEGKDIVDHGADLIEQNKDKLGVYYGVAKENPSVFYKEIADQVYGRNSDGSISLRPDAEVEARDQFGDDIVDLAKVMYPGEEAKPSGKSVEPERSNSQEVKPAVAEYKPNIRDDYFAQGDFFTPEEKAKFEKLDDAGKDKMIDEKRAELKVSPEDNIPVSELMGKQVTYKGKRGILYQDGQSVVFKEESGNKEYELGNVNDLSGKSAKELGIGTEKSVVDADAEGHLTVRGKTYVNPFEERGQDPTDAILYDKDGDIVNVRLKTPDGERRTFTGPVAEDLAYQIHLKEISKNNEQPALEEFINSEPEIRKEVENGGLAEPAEEKPVVDTEKVPGVSGEEEKPVVKEKKKEVPKKKEPVEPPKPPESPAPRAVEDSPQDEYTAVRKEKQKEVKGAKALFEQQKVVKWTETYDSALSNVQAMYPDKGLYDAMKSRIGHFTALLDSGTLFNPTSEDIAVFNVFKDETRRRMNEITGWDSTDNVQRMAAVAEFNTLQNDLFNVVRVTNPGGEAGRAFNLLQSEIAQDPDRGLQIRRMELLGAKGGDRLTEEDLAFTAENWEKERALIAKEQDLKEKGMQERFDKEMGKVKADYEEKLKKAREDKKTPDAKEKREKLLKEKGADLAAKIRSGKLKGTYATFPGLTQAINVVIEGVAKLVEGGYSLAQAIDEYVQANKIKDKDKFTNDLFTVFNKQEKQDETYNKIQKLAKSSGATDVTVDMAGKNLIRDYINSHVGLHDISDVLDVAHQELKKLLPDLEKNRMVEAYLKQGDFKQPTKVELESGFKQAQKNFDRLAKLEKDVNDLTGKGELYKKTTNKLKTPFDKEIEAKEAEKKAIMNSMGIKTSGEDKYTKATYEQRAKSHNDRIESVGNNIQSRIDKGDLSPKTEKALIKLKNQLDAAKITIDPSSALSQSKTLDGGLALLKSIKSEFNRNSVDDISSVSDINRSLQKMVDQFNSDKDNSVQDVKLQRAKDRAKRDAESIFQKISNGEYEDKVPVDLTKTDAQLIKLERDKNAIRQEYENRKKEFEKKNKPWVWRIAEFARALEVTWLIGKPFTLLKVAGSAAIRPNLEAATRMTIGKLFDAIPSQTTKAISERAKLGGESSSIQSIKKGYEAYLRQYNPEQLKKLYADANDKYQKSSVEYLKAKYEVDHATSPSEASVKKLAILKEKMNTDLVGAVGNSIYEYIAGSSIKDGLEVLLHRSVQLERQFGDFDREQAVKWKKGDSFSEHAATTIDNLNYVMNFIGRSHGALKNFSARFSFATGFMARLEYAVKNDIDVSSVDKILEIAHASYADFERGKYQESNPITDKWNEITNAVDKISPISAYIMRADVAITRVPVNMLREGVMEYTLGALTGSYMAAKEYLAAKKIVLQSQWGPDEQAQFKKELSEQLNKMDPDKAAAIVRAYRKGGFGIGLYALAILGNVSFGGWAHKGQTAEDKKKLQRELETGEPEIKTGEIKIGEWKLPEAAAKILEHTPAFDMLGFGLGLAQTYKNNIVDGRSTPESAANAAMAQVNHIVGSIPMIDKALLPMAKGAVDAVKPSGKWDDVDQEGNPMKRQAFHISDYLNYLPGVGKKEDILSENYYKAAVQIRKSYRQNITDVETNTSLSKKEKEEQRAELLKDYNEQIDEVYKQNKENPQ